MEYGRMGDDELYYGCGNIHERKEKGESFSDVVHSGTGRGERQGRMPHLNLKPHVKKAPPLSRSLFFRLFFTTQAQTREVCKYGKREEREVTKS